MPGVANRDALLAGLATGLTYPIIKRPSVATGAAAYYSDAFAWAGTPPAGIAANAQTTSATCNCTTVGAVPLPVAAAGKTWYVAIYSAALSDTAGSVALWDRLAHRGNIAYNAGAVSINLGLPARVSDYSTVAAFLTAAPSSTATSATLSYTNQDGLAAQSTGAITLYTTAFSLAATGYPLQPVPLATGDAGIKSVETITPAGGTTGTYGLVLARPLVPAVATMPEGDSQQGWLSIVDAGADPCLFVVAYGNANNTRQCNAVVRAFQA